MVYPNTVFGELKTAPAPVPMKDAPKTYEDMQASDGLVVAVCCLEKSRYEFLKSYVTEFLLARFCSCF